MTRVQHERASSRVTAQREAKGVREDHDVDERDREALSRLLVKPVEHEPAHANRAVVGPPPGAREARPGGASPALPCLNSHNCMKAVLSPGARKTAFALARNVKAMADRHGIERLLFNTLTFADHVLDGREAQRRLHSLATNVLRYRYTEYVTVMERQVTGRIHYHLLCSVAFDVRTGYDFEAASKRDYRSACLALRSEWAFWRKTAKAYGFGRTEQQPVRSTGEGIAKYIGKYISKHLDARRQDDRGLRLVRYSQHAKTHTSNFAWNSRHARLFRAKLKKWARGYGITEYEQLQEVFGPRWAYKHGDAIAATLLPREELSQDLWDIQIKDTLETCRAVADTMGEQWWDVLSYLFRRDAVSTGS